MDKDTSCPIAISFLCIYVAGLSASVCVCVHVCSYLWIYYTSLYTNIARHASTTDGYFIQWSRMFVC